MINTYFKQTWSVSFAKFVSGITIILATAVLLGWIFYFWIAEEYFHFIFAFKPNTAICFILSGIVLWSCSEEQGQSIIIKLITSAIFLISTLTLFEYFFHIDLYIDEFIFKEPLATHSVLAPGRMSPLSAMNFVLLSFTFFFLDNKVINYRIYTFLVLIVLVISIFEFLLYLYTFAHKMTPHPVTVFQMPFLASILFIAIGLGILFVRPYRGFISVLISKNNSGILARRLILPAILFPAIFGYIFMSGTIGESSAYSVTIIVLATSIFISCLILITSFFVNRNENEEKRNALDLKQFQTLALKSAGAGTWNWNVKKNQLVCDNHLHKLFGITFGSFPSHFEAIYNFIHPQDRKRIDDEIKYSLKHKSEFESHFRVFHPDDSIHHLATRGHIYRDRHGNAIRMTGICWDITQQIKIEDELRQSKEIAEKLAEEADEANRAKSAFLAAMSHEIRTPLNGVMGTIELLYDTPLTQEQRDFISTVRSSGDDLLAVINDIIDYSKIESGRFELEIVDFNLQSLLDDTVERFISPIQDKGLSIDAVIDPNIPEFLNGDASRVRQILTKLLSNAIKFTEKGEITVRIKLLETTSPEARDSQEYKIQFEVTDTGIGITPEVKERLFKPFSQGDFSNKRKHGGTGLGLVISKRLVEVLDGSIGFESTAGVGSKFWFMLPFRPCELQVPEKKYDNLSEYAAIKILCVDDNPISREIMERQIRSWKLDCTLSPNGGHALSLLLKAAEENKPFDLALIDYQMPGMSGLELIKIIRRLTEIEKTNVIILSPSGASFGLEEMKKLRIMMCLTKPLRKSDLYSGIKTALQMIQNHQDPIFYLTEMKEKQNINILLAEDNMTNREVALRILAKLGYQVDAVSNGLKVLEAIKNKEYQVILMDCQMPEMDGYTATKEIRKQEEKEDKHIFIIAMTAHALKGDRQKCIQAGMDDYIAKPVDSAMLSSTLQKWLGNVTLTQPPNESDKETEIQTEKSAEIKLIDMDRINEIFGDDKAGIQLFLQSFFDATAELLTQLATAIENKDQQLSKDLYHRLKGSSGNGGITKLYQLSVEGEKHIVNGSWGEAKNIYDEIIEVFNDTKKEAETILN